MAMDMKTCSTCHKSYPLDDYRSPGKPHIFRMCIQCRLRFRNRSRMRRKKDLVPKQQSPSQNEQKTVDPAPKCNTSYSLFLPTFYPMSTTPPPEENTKCPTSSSSSTASTVVGEPQDDVTQPIPTQVNVPTPSRVSTGTQTIETGEETMPMDSLPLHFVCTHCQVPRSVRLHGLCICIYCLQHEQKYCVRGQHEMDRPDFVDLDGMEFEVCNQCRGRDS